MRPPQELLQKDSRLLTDLKLRDFFFHCILFDVSGLCNKSHDTEKLVKSSVCRSVSQNHMYPRNEELTRVPMALFVNTFQMKQFRWVYRLRYLSVRWLELSGDETLWSLVGVIPIIACVDHLLVVYL